MKLKAYQIKEKQLSQSEYDRVYATHQLKRAKNPFRSIIKKTYLNNIMRDVIGPAIDFGCGAGQLLEQLPKGSVGLEVNPYIVEALDDKLPVIQYIPEEDCLNFSNFQTNYFKTFIMSHVLEHFENVTEAMKLIFKSCRRLGIERIIIVVPGAKGFNFDGTHKTFIDEKFIESNHLLEMENYKVSLIKYFPLNRKELGNFFVFHELKIVYDYIRL